MPDDATSFLAILCEGFAVLTGLYKEAVEVKLGASASSMSGHIDYGVARGRMFRQVGGLCMEDLL